MIPPNPRDSGADAGTGTARPIPVLPVQAAMIAAARSGDAPWVAVEQVVVTDPAPAPAAHVVARALDTLARRHEGLRLVAAQAAEGAAEGATEGGAPVWQVRRRPVASLTTRDWSALAPAQQDRALARLLAEDRAAGFDLAASPGWRVLLADTGARGHVLVLSVHHALLDAPAMAVVIEELFDLIAGRAPEPAAHHSATPRDPEGDGLRAAVARLAALPDDAPAQARALLAGFDAPVLLCAAAPEAGPARMRQISRVLSPETSAAFRARAAGTGRFPMVQAAWALVLARWTGETDLAFGLTLAGRNLHPDMARTVGCLIATLPQRAELDDRPDLDALALRLRARSGVLRGLHGASTDALRDWAGLAPGRALYDSLLVFSPATLGRTLAARGKGWEGRGLRLIEEGDTPLTLAIYDDPAMVLELEHDPTRFAPDQADRLLDHVAQMLASIAASAPGVATGDLAMLTPPEAAALAQQAQPARPVPPGQPDPAARLAALAAQGPSRPALAGPAGPALDRAGLAQRAGALAAALRAQAAPGARIAVHLPRGMDWVVTLVACLRAGMVFAPLDPAQPAELCAAVARDAGCALLVARADLQGLALPRLAPDAAAAPAAPAGDLPDAAYLIHTSGTTGRPKGVIGSRAALAAHAAAIIDAYDLRPSDRVLALAAPAFDVALEEVLPTLLAGATVVLAPPEALDSVPVLLDLIAAERVSVLNLPASLWHLLADEMARRDLALPPSVRLVVTGSERVAPQALALWRRIAPGLPWINAYGPTEATITALAHRVEPGDPATDPAAPVPIGRPLGHATARVLAFDGSPAPQGAPGELVLGGAAVALGYLDRPDETARAFVPDRFGPPGARAYRTGDRARLAPDGRIAFLGRRDRQVKLRGHRIDLGGVEQVLAGLPGVRGAHVAPDPGGAARLVAWVWGPVADGGAAPNPADTGAPLAALRAAAARALPGHALPVLVPVAELPLRPNGKIDLARLPRPPAHAEGPVPDRSAPVPALLAEVAALMAGVLGLEAIDPDADFRDLGGHSLAALRLAGAIETRFARRTRTTDLYRHPTARALAAHLAAPPGAGPRYLVPIRPQGRGVPFYAIHVLGEKESLWRPLAEVLGPDIPVWGMTMGPAADPDGVDIPTIARAYCADILAHQPEGPVALGAVSMAAYFAYELAQQLRAAGREVRLLAVFDAEGPGGRPALRGRAKLVAHARRLRAAGWAHLWAVLRARFERYRIARDLARSAGRHDSGGAQVLANIRAVEAYRPAPYAGAIAVFRAADSFWDSPEALESALGWAPVARGAIERHDIPGDHLTILEAGNVAAVAGVLARRLAPPPEGAP